MKISLIICCKDEERSLACVIHSAKKYASEIIVIDGHSTDTSCSIAKQNGVKVFIDNGKGKGAGIQLGIRKATGDIIVFMDADGSHQASDIPKLIKPIINNTADLVIASRGKGGSDELHGEFEKTLRLIGSTVITQVINWRYHSHITDSQNGYRAIRSSIAKQLCLKENSFAIEQEMLMLALKKNISVQEVGSHEYERKFGKSKISLYKMWWKYGLNLVYHCCH